jgi:hypothetical protein
MTQDDFKKLPFLLTPHQLLEATGYDKRTVGKLVECCHLVEVRPAGLTERRYRKVQVAMLAGLEWKEEAERFRQEPLLMPEKTVVNWTGYGHVTLDVIVRASHPASGTERLRLVRVRPAGMSGGKFRKLEVGALLGLERYV